MPGYLKNTHLKTLQLPFLCVSGSKGTEQCLTMFTWTVVLKVRCSPNPNVLCVIRTCSRVTAQVPVLKTTRLPCSNSRCCHIRVFFFTLIWQAVVMHYWPWMATSAVMTTLLWTICYPTGLTSAHFPEILDLLFICIPAGAEQPLARISQVHVQGFLCGFNKDTELRVIRRHAHPFSC